MAGSRKNVRTDPAHLEQALALFDETVRALEARSRRLEEVLTVKQAELATANRRLAEQVGELDRIRAWVEMVLASVASGVIAVDRTGTVTTCNRAAAEVLSSGGLGSVAGKPYAVLAQAGGRLDTVLAQGGEHTYEWHLAIPGHGRRILASRAAAIVDTDGQAVGAVEVFEDVTNLRALQEQLGRDERLRSLGEMAAGVAHEIRNPLNGIEGFASLLQRECPEGSTAARYARAVSEGVRHLNRTVTGLLEFTQAKPPRKRPIPILELVRDCLDLVQGEAAAARLELIAEAQPTVDCDSTQIRQVLLNLLQNAVQIAGEHHAAPQVQVRVAATELADRPACVLIVDDDGPGVPTELRPRLFTPFVTTRAGGTGLGLAVVHALVERHGGTIAIDDSPLGGARFQVVLPC